MKKILISFLMCMLVLPVYATKMCAANDTVVVVLDPSVAGTGYTYDNVLGTWTTTFPYGKVSGTSACLSSAYGKSGGGWIANLTDVDAQGVERPVIGGERHGQYCWCKMTHPAASRWVFDGDGGSASYCASYCTHSCGNRAQYYSWLRVGLFGSVASN